MIKYILYITINLCNGKFYIGIHKTNPEIFDGYIGDGIKSKGGATLDVPFHRAVRKYGYENFRRTTLAVVDTLEEAKKLEGLIVTKELIRSKSCYNATVGGNIPPINSKRVYKFALNGEYLRSFSSIRDAARDLFPDKNEQSVANNIAMNCKGELRQAYGFYWSFTKNFNYLPCDRKKQIAQYTLSGKFLRYYDSVEEAEEGGQIYSSLKGNGTANGYQWRYYNGDNSNILPIKRFQKPEKEILVYDENDNFLYEYPSILKLIEEHSEFKKSGIYNVLCGLTKTYKKHKFKYKNDDIV